MSEETNNDIYVHNYKMHYEAKRKELDILLTSSIPTQLSNMKTILWINFLMIGLTLQFIKKFPLPDIVIGFFLLSLCAIFLILIAMLSNRTKEYGVPDDVAHMNSYDNNDGWMKCTAIKVMLGATHGSIIENRKVIVGRAKLMHLATYFTFCSLLLIVIVFAAKHLNL